MHDLDTLIRLNDEAAERELGRGYRVGDKHPAVGCGGNVVSLAEVRAARERTTFRAGEFYNILDLLLSPEGHSHRT